MALTKTIGTLAATAALTATAGMASAAPIGETGRIQLASTIDDGVIETVTLRNTYVDPVVVAFINTRNGGESVQVRVDDVTPTGFDIFMQEPDNQGHAAETISYLVVERGAHTLRDGTRLEAGTVDTDTTHRGGQGFAGDPVLFETDFDAAPAVLHGLNTYDNADFMASLATAVGADGFEIGLEAAETGKPAAVETVAYIAIQTGEGTLDGAPYAIGSGDDGSSDGVGQPAHAITFDAFDAAPDVIVSVYGQNGVDGSWARGAGYDAASQRVYAEEDQIRDSERGHANETFAYAAFAADTDLEPATGHRNWRIRNVDSPSTSQWVIRELAFCRDAACAEPLTGTAIDSGDAMGWAPASNAFDGDPSTMWKTNGTVDGGSYIGLDIGYPVEVGGLFFQADNAVYAISALTVEYYDDDAGEWVVADYLGGLPVFTDVEREVTVRDRFPTAWRIRNDDTPSSAQWSFRELDFCADAACAAPLAGAAIDHGDAYDWAPAANAFDDDISTLWKTRAIDPGEGYIGLAFDTVTEVAGLYLRTDNVVYSVEGLFVEYYDVVAGEWVTADYINDLAINTDNIVPVTVRDRFPLAWRIRNVDDTTSNNIVIREMDLCADAACAEPLTGAVIDSGHAMSWAPATAAFDGDFDTMYKSTTAAAGEVFIGLEFDGITELEAIALRTDNSVYSPDGIYVEYLDLLTAEWVTAETFTGLPAQTELVLEL